MPTAQRCSSAEWMRYAVRSALCKCAAVAANGHDIDHSGLIVPAKAVKFKVEFTVQSNGSPLLPSGWQDESRSKACTLTMVMEKGAHSTFKTISGLVRKSWQYA